MLKGRLPWWLSGKESACNAGDLGLIPGSGRSPGRGNSNPLWHSCLESLTVRGSWQAAVHSVAKCQTWVKWLSSSSSMLEGSSVVVENLKVSCVIRPQPYPLFPCLLTNCLASLCLSFLTFKMLVAEFLGGPVVMNPPSRAGDTVWTLLVELRSHMLQDSWAHGLQLERSPCTTTRYPACHNWDPRQPNKYVL